MPTLVGHFVSFPREREKRDGRGDEREEQGRKRNRNENEETEQKHSLSTLTCYKALPNCKPISVGRPGNTIFTTPLHHQTTPTEPFEQICQYPFNRWPHVKSGENWSSSFREEDV